MPMAFIVNNIYFDPSSNTVVVATALSAEASLVKEGFRETHLL